MPLAIMACGSEHTLPVSPVVPSGPAVSPPPVPMPNPASAPIQDGVRITGLEQYTSFVVAQDFIDIGAASTKDGVTTDCTATAKWTVSNPAIAEITTKPKVRLKGRPGTTDISAECARRMIKKVVRLKIVHAGYDWTDVAIEWNGQPVMTEVVSLVRVGTPILNERFTTNSQEYSFDVTSSGIVRVDTVYSRWQKQWRRCVVSVTI